MSAFRYAVRVQVLEGEKASDLELDTPPPCMDTLDAKVSFACAAAVSGSVAADIPLLEEQYCDAGERPPVGPT